MTKKQDKLIALSKVADMDVLDSVKASRVETHPWRRAYGILFEAQRYWNNMQDFRERRERCKRYNYGRQWDDYVEVRSRCGIRRRVREEDLIRSKGNIPLKNNLIRRLVKNVLGVYRSQSKEPTCTARDKDEQKYGETMSVVLQYCRNVNRQSELDARTLEEFLISGAAVQKKKYGWQQGRLECWTEMVSPNTFFVDNNFKDPRGFDVSCLGQVHDVSFLEVQREFAKCEEDVKRLRSIYSPQAYNERIADNFQKFGQYELRNLDFFSPSNPNLCRVIEVWRKEYKPRYLCHDYNNGDAYKIEIEDYEELVLKENAERKRRCLEAGMPESEVPIITTEWFMDDYWYFYYLTPFGDILREGETPYDHGEHPYVFKFYPFIDGEIHSFVEDVIDQQRYVNRLTMMYDFILRASAKGMLLIPDDAKPKDMSWSDIADEWSRFNGIVRFKPSKSGQIPQQIANNCTNIGIGDLLSMQLKFFEDISGVNGALQGKPGVSGTSGSLYAQQTQNATMSLLDILETFSQFVIDGAYKDVKNIQQYYDTKKTVNIVGRAGQVIEYDPKRIRDVEFDINITESTLTPAYRQLANDFLMQLWAKGAIQLEWLLQVGDFPFGDELLQCIKSAKENYDKNGQMPQMDPNLQQQIQAQLPQNAKAQAMLQQMMSGQGIPPEQQGAPMAEESQQ